MFYKRDDKNLFFYLATKTSRDTKYLTCILKKLLILSWLFDNGMKLLHW